MAVLPDQQRMKRIEDRCLEWMEKGTPMGAAQIAEDLVLLPDMPMHCPYHHFLVPAALLTSAHLHAGSTTERLAKDLKLAKERAGMVPGGICGQWGSCGAALGVGIFSAIWRNTSPLSKDGWANGNLITARCLEEIATVEGPRCCKRVTYLAIRAAVTIAREELGVDMGAFPEMRCRFSSQNRECRKEACPFYAGE